MMNLFTCNEKRSLRKGVYDFENTELRVWCKETGGLGVGELEGLVLGNWRAWCWGIGGIGVGEFEGLVLGNWRDWCQGISRLGDEELDG